MATAPSSTGGSSPDKKPTATQRKAQAEKIRKEVEAQEKPKRRRLTWAIIVLMTVVALLVLLVLNLNTSSSRAVAVAGLLEKDIAKTQGQLSDANILAERLKAAEKARLEQEAKDKLDKAEAAQKVAEDELKKVKAEKEVALVTSHPPCGHKAPVEHVCNCCKATTPVKPTIKKVIFVPQAPPAPKAEVLLAPVKVSSMIWLWHPPGATAEAPQKCIIASGEGKGLPRYCSSFKVSSELFGETKEQWLVRVGGGSNPTNTGLYTKLQ